MVLRTKGGFIYETQDHTDWFRENRGEEAVKNYHKAIIDNACLPKFAGSIENIKGLAIVDDENNIVNLLVSNGLIL